jgi:hypothetical protein
MLRELAGKSRTMPVRLAAELRCAKADIVDGDDCWRTHELVAAPLRLRDWLADAPDSRQRGL